MAAHKTLRADPSPDGKFTVKQVRRVACDQPPPPSPNGTTPTHTTEYSSTESVLLNPNRRHPNPPNDYCFLEIGVAMCVANDCFFWFCNGATPTHTNAVVRKVCCSTPIVATPTLPIITFSDIGVAMCAPNDCFFWFAMVPHPHTHTHEYSSTKSVLLNPNRRHPNPPNDHFFQKFRSPCV